MTHCQDERLILLTEEAFYIKFFNKIEALFWEPP